MSVKFGRVEVHRRGLQRHYKVTPFIRFRPINIGSTRLYCWGPLGIFVEAKRKPLDIRVGRRK